MYEYYMEVAGALMAMGFLAGCILGVFLLFIYSTIKYKNSESEQNGQRVDWAKDEYDCERYDCCECEFYQIYCINEEDEEEKNKGWLDI